MLNNLDSKHKIHSIKKQQERQTQHKQAARMLRFWLILFFFSVLLYQFQYFTMYTGVMYQQRHSHQRQQR